MATASNPFEELYLSETIPPKEFVKLFSPYLVRFAAPLFQPGNVILKGVQGSGKTMLLSLLEPKIRLAYAQTDDAFPVPEEFRRFISGGINFRKSHAILFGQRAIHPDPKTDAEQFPIYFADFINYWIVNDLLSTVCTYVRECDGAVGRELGIDASPARLNLFARRLATDSCWIGGLEDVSDFAGLQESLERRILDYFKYLNFNIDSIPASISHTKTTAGVPIAHTARLLKECEVIPEEVAVLIRIDQYEELGKLPQFVNERARAPRQIVNRMLGLRDASVSYRVGTRRYAWREDLRMYGTTANLELEREYTEVDIDGILERRENQKTYVFDEFAADVLNRRLRAYNYRVEAARMGTLRRIFGRIVTPARKARMYAGQESGCSPSRIIETSDDRSRPYSPDWHTLLLKLAGDDPLQAKLAAAWARQRKGVRLEESPPESDGLGNYPWDREWWRKERIELALMQLAAGCRQRMVWAGERDILLLSGGNILVFVSLCSHIWGAWLRSVADAKRDALKDTPPTIDPRIQSIGIHEASQYWHQKTTELPGGNARQRFMDVLGRTFQKQLLKDVPMSYPGHNGFSVVDAELRNWPDLQRFLNDAVDYGDLVDVRHTTKEKDRLQRTKYYLKPILSPYFRIPASHLKEPLYVSVEQVLHWREEAEGVPTKREVTSDRRPDPRGGQLGLFAGY